MISDFAQKESLDKYQALTAVFDATPDALIITDDQGKIIMVNRQSEVIFGYSKDEMLGNEIELLIPEQVRKKHVAERNGYIAEPTVRKMGTALDLFARKKDGTEFPVEIMLSPIKLADKTLVAAAVRDITDRKQIETKLLENEKKYRTTLDNMLEGVFIIDFDLRLIYINNSSVKQSRIRKEKILGHILTEVFPGIEQTELFRAYQECMTERVSKQIEVEFRFPDNSNGWFQLSIQPIPEGVFVLSMEITERKEAENKLKESEERYRSLIESTNELILRINAEGEVVYFNPAFKKIIEYSEAEIMGMHLFNLLHPDFISLSEDTIVRTFKGEKIDFIERVLISKSGRKISVEGNLTPIFSNGEVSGVQAFYRDVTERKKAEAEIESQKKFTDAVLNNLPADIAVFDARHNYIFINKQAISTPELRHWLIGKNDFDFCRYKGIEEGLAHKRRKFFNEAVQAKEDVEWVDHHPSPAGTNSVLRKFHPVFENDELKYVIGYGINISNRIKMEDELFQTRQKLQHLLDSSPAIIYSSEASGNYATTYISENVKAQLGYEPKEFLEDGNFWSKHIHPDDSQKVFDELFSVFKIGRHRIEYRFMHKNGTYKWMMEEIHLIRDNEKNPAEIVGVWMDVTDRKNAELKLKEAMLSSQNAYKELEQFSYMVSHDLQEPLRMVTGFLNLLKLETDDQLDDSAREYISYAVDGAERMKILIQDLLQYSRVGTNKEDYKATDLNEVLKYTTHVLGEIISDNDAVITVDKLPVINGIETLLNQLFVNLISNALKYRSEEKPQIEVGWKDEKDQRIFYVKDNGIGINSKYFESIFVIFQRLHSKKEYSGTGVGLAICKKIVEKHHGHIWVESEGGKGTTFYFALPKNYDYDKQENIIS